MFIQSRANKNLDIPVLNYLYDRYPEVFNYMTNRYQRAYEPDSLWNTFFLGQEDLRSVIERRRINSLDELVYRASEYFESYKG